MNTVKEITLSEAENIQASDGYKQFVQMQLENLIQEAYKFNEYIATLGLCFVEEN
jgi:hypothetical protein